MLNEVADGVWVRQSSWVWSNSTVVRTDAGLVLVDPGIDGAELDALADDIDPLGLPVIAGFSTHPHWDHLLWHPRFGNGPRYATAATAQIASEARERGQQMASESATGIPLELLGLVTPLPIDGGGIPGELIEHEAHASGHAAILLRDRGVLIAGDMLSDVLVPILNRQAPDAIGTYEKSLDRLGDAAAQVTIVIPGHGAVATGPEIETRFTADRAFLDALRREGDSPDERWGPRG